MGKLNNEERFKHISYHYTDVRETWAREIKRIAKLAEQQKVAEAEQSVKIRTIKVKA